VSRLVEAAGAGPLLDARIAAAFAEAGATRVAASAATVRAAVDVPTEGSWAAPVVHLTTLDQLDGDSPLVEECFGPSAVVAEYADEDALLSFVERLDGQLAAGVHADADDPADAALAAALLRRLSDRAGRVVFNGWPTGVAVTYAMHHGGPYPAATDAAYTSVGPPRSGGSSGPVCYQGVPDALLPPALQAANPLGITRQVDGRSVTA
jgi:NADP-dependent aldehyde dehydrogenase